MISFVKFYSAPLLSVPASSQSHVKALRGGKRKEVSLTPHTDFLGVLPIASEASDSAFHLKSKTFLMTFMQYFIYIYICIVKSITLKRILV